MDNYYAMKLAEVVDTLNGMNADLGSLSIDAVPEDEFGDYRQLRQELRNVRCLAQDMLERSNKAAANRLECVAAVDVVAKPRLG